MALKCSKFSSKNHLSIMNLPWWYFSMKGWEIIQVIGASEIPFIKCVAKWKKSYAKISKNGPNIWAHCGQQWAQNYNSALTDTWHSGIMSNVPYLVMGKIPKIKWFSQLNFISTYRAWVCVWKFLWFHMWMKSAVMKSGKPWFVSWIWSNNMPFYEQSRTFT